MRMKDSGLVSGFDGRGAVNNSSDDEDILTNTMGSEDFIPETDGSGDDHIKPIHGDA